MKWRAGNSVRQFSGILIAQHAGRNVFASEDRFQRLRFFLKIFYSFHQREVEV